MARIDKFIKAIHQAGGERLVMASGEKAVMILRGEPRPISAKPATASQIQDLAREILPAGSDVPAPTGGDSRFDYAAPSGAVQVRIVGGNGALRLEIAPAGPAARKSESSHLAGRTSKLFCRAKHLAI